MVEKKTGAAKHSADHRRRQNTEAERLGIEEVTTLLPAEIKKPLAEAKGAHGYTQVKKLWHDVLSWIDADPA